MKAGRIIFFRRDEGNKIILAMVSKIEGRIHEHFFFKENEYTAIFAY